MDNYTDSSTRKNMIDVVKDGEIIPAKVVYVRNRNKRKESLCLISTDVNAKATLT